MSQQRDAEGAEGPASGSTEGAARQSTVECGPEVCPAGMCVGRGHVIVYGNPAMISRFGTCVGMPAREALLGLPREAFDLLDAVYARSKPLARSIRYEGRRWRMTSVPRIDAVDGGIYGVSFHMQPVVRAEAGEPSAS